MTKPKLIVKNIKDSKAKAKPRSKKMFDIIETENGYFVVVQSGTAHPDDMFSKVERKDYVFTTKEAMKNFIQENL